MIVMSSIRLAPIHPGTALLHDFIKSMGLARGMAAKLISAPQRRIPEICSCKRADTAIRLACLFGMPLAA